MIQTRLEALTAGAGADALSFSGTVHSVFARACNIAVAPDRLLGLVAREIGAVPRGFTLATPAGFDFAATIGAGRRATARNGVLRIDGAALAVDLRTARPWRSNLPDAAIALGDAGTARAWRAAWAALDRHGGATPFASAAAAPVQTLAAASRSGERAALADAVARLIGLGDGLTPAGDDFLIGFLAGLWSAAPVRARDARAAVGETVAANAARTGTISRHYLEAAIDGEVSAPLARLAAVIGGGDAAGAEEAAAAALSVGASSGAAASYGLLLAAALMGQFPVLPLLPGHAARR